MQKVFSALYILIFLCVSSCNDTGKNNFNEDKDNIQKHTEHIDDLISERKFKETQAYIDSLEKFYPNPSIYFDFKILEMRRQLAFEQKDYATALAYSNEIINLIGNDNRFTADHIYALFIKGDIYEHTGNYQSAYTNFVLARKLSEKIKDSCSLGNYDYRIAMVLFRQEKYEESSAFFYSGFNYFNSCERNFPNQFRQQEILNNIALCLYQLGEFDEALMWYDSALHTLTRIEVNKPEQKRFAKMAEGVINGNIGKTLIALGKTEEAIPYLQKNIAINLQYLYDRKDALTSLIALAKVQLTQKHFSEYKKSADIIHHYLDSIDQAATFRKDLFKLNADYYYAIRQTDSALFYLNRYNTINDSLISKEKKLARDDIQTTIEGINRESELSILRKDNELKDRYVLFTIISLVLTIIIAGLLLSRWIYTRRQNRVLAKLNSEIELREREKDRILSIVAHDLRNPIGGIKMVAELKVETEEDPNNKEAFELILTSCMNSLELINEILLFTKLQSGSNQFKLEKVDFNRFMQQTVEFNNYKAAEKNQHLSLFLPDEEIEAKVNVEKLRRALSNIIQNAIKFSFRDSRIIIRVEKKENDIEISIQDQGIGIPPKLHHEIFDAFTKSQRVGTEGEKPFGLGLSIVKQIVELHKGKIWLESEEGKGTTFFIRLPVID